MSGGSETTTLVEIDGDLDRTFPLGEVLVPLGCRVQSDGFRWTGLELKEPPSGAPLLENFMKLVTASDDSIFRYARRFGVMGVCEHGTFGGHIRDVDRGSPNGAYYCPEHNWERDREGFETFHQWRAYSRRANAILKVAERLNGNRCGTREDWATIFGRSAGELKPQLAYVTAIGADPLSDALASWFSQNPFAPNSACEVRLGDVANEWRLLADALNGWLRISRVRPWVTLRGSKLTFAVSGGGLFGAIGLRLTYAVCAIEGYAICAACSQFDRPKRKPKSGQRYFCEKCRGAQEPIKFAMRDTRLRKSKARTLHKSGTSPEEIARQIGRGIDQVRKWAGIEDNSKGERSHGSKTRRK
jgi:hypothetical protein